MRALALALALFTALSLSACQGQGNTGAVPSSVAESSGVPEASPDSSDPTEMETSPGVETQVLVEVATKYWNIGNTLELWDGHLLSETRYQEDFTRADLDCYDLATGEQVFSLPLDQYRREGRLVYDLRQVFGESGGFSIFTDDGFQKYDWNGSLLEDYTLPEAARVGEGYPYNNYLGRDARERWDALPERDLLAWCGPEGLWVSDAAGEDPRLVLAVEAIGHQPEFPEFAQTVEDLRDLEPGEQVGFRSARLMDEGRLLSADFGSPQMQNGVLGHVVVSLADGTAKWFAPYFVGAPGSGSLEYQDDTHILAGTTLIDAVTGETSRAARWELTDRFVAITGDFSRYYGVEETDAGYRLLCYDTEDRETTRLLLTLPGKTEDGPADDRSYTRFYSAAAAGDQVVCRFSTPLSEGFMLVTAPEK